MLTKLQIHISKGDNSIDKLFPSTPSTTVTPKSNLTTIPTKLHFKVLCYPKDVSSVLASIICKSLYWVHQEVGKKPLYLIIDSGAPLYDD